MKNETPYELRKQYASALQEYLSGGGETALERAYELGRKAMAEGLGILDITAIHQEALVAVIPDTPAPETGDTINKAAQFFAECMAPFEMTFRGFQESIARLHNLNYTLEQSEMKLRTVVQAANDAIISSDNNGNIISWNKRAQNIFGYTEDEVLGKQLTILMPERYQNVYSNGIERLRSSGKSKYNGRTLESHGLNKNGIEFPIEISIASWETGEGAFFTGIVRDITDRKRAEEQLKEQAVLLRREIIERRRAEEQIRERALLLDQAQDAIAVRDQEHRIIYWNKGAEHLYGWTEKEIMGKNAEDFIYKEESPQLIEAKKSVFERGNWSGELRQVTKEGKDVIVDSRWSLTYDRKGAPKSILIINTNITEKKKLEQQFLRTQRLESIGTLASGIAHDINNLLTPMMLSAQILRGKIKDEQSTKLLDIIDKNTRRGSDLMKQVLSFSRGVEGKRNPIQVTGIISEIEKIAKETFPKYIEIRTSVSPYLKQVTGDATQLHQVLMNLCVNARDAMPGGGILDISGENLFIDEKRVQMNIDARVGEYIVLTVSDTGSGIPPEIMDRIFEPFFSTKGTGKGTGLGLSTTITIVKSHSGFIDVQSEVGKGTTFRVYLPAAQTTGTQEASAQPVLLRGAGETILVVDDEAPIRESTCEILEIYGYNAIAACDGVEAISQYTMNSKEIKVVIIDMSMPVMDGPTCIQGLLKINPEVKIIAVSGLIEKETFSKVEDDVIALLTKPYTAEYLLKKIHEVVKVHGPHDGA